MRERRDIVKLARQARHGVLVTLVGVNGSSYRRPGAQMLLSADGHSAGMISAGCLEAEIARRAFWKIQYGAVVERIATAVDGDDEMPFGLGCGGTLDLLLEPLETESCRALIDAMERSLEGVSFHIRTRLPTGISDLQREVCSESRVVLYSDLGTERNVHADYLEILSPPKRLIIMGAGEDARAPARLAHELGWEVLIFDGRAHFIKPDRFPDAQSVECRSTLSDFSFRSNDSVILITHSFEQDRGYLTELLQQNVGYIGLLGSKDRSCLLIAEASRAAGVSLERACDLVRAQVGLDLGGDGPEAIALSIISEIQAVTECRSALPRRMTVECVKASLLAGKTSPLSYSACDLAPRK